MDEGVGGGSEYLVTDDMLDLYKVVGATDASIRVMDGNVPMLVDPQSMKPRGDKFGPTFRFATAEDLDTVRRNQDDYFAMRRALNPNAYSGRTHDWYIRLMALFDEPKEENAR